MVFEKTPENLWREYNDDKYAPLLGEVSMSAALSKYLGPDDLIEVSRHGELSTMHKHAAYVKDKGLIVESLRPLLSRTDCVMELGAGFGQTLWFIREAFPHLRYIAGEYTENGVALGKKLMPEVEWERFNFYDDRWNILGKAKHPLVITVHAVEMLPDAHRFVERMHDCTIVNFEPIYEKEDTSELSEKRKAYIEKNHYCQNILQSIPDPKSVERDFFGLNPLFTEARIEWSAS